MNQDINFEIQISDIEIRLFINKNPSMDKLIAKWNDTMKSGPRSRENSMNKGHKLNDSYSKNKSILQSSIKK